MLAELKQFRLPYEAELNNPPAFVLVKEVGVVKDYTAYVPMNHRLEADGLAYTNAMASSTIALIESELQSHGGLKFLLVLTA